jgi:hypothetical protein
MLANGKLDRSYLVVLAAALVVLGKPRSYGQMISLDQASAPIQSNRQIQATYGKLPLTLEANKGQTDRQVKFLAHAAGYTIFLTAGEMVVAVRPSTVNSNGENPGPGVISNQLHSNAEGAPSFRGRVQHNKSTHIRLNLVGANQNAEIVGEDRQPGTINYFIGSDPAKWRTKIPTFRQVRYKGLYPGIDLLYYGSQSRVEHDFIVAAGANPNLIQFAVKGADGLKVNSDGDLVLAKGKDEICFKAPRAYQEFNGMRRPVKVAYLLPDSTHFSFRIGQHDQRLPLVIDPVLVYSTLLGGSMDDVAVAIQTDTSGNSYVAGYTDSVDFPGISGNSAPSGMNAFVAKLDASGSNLIYADYIGGTGDDYAFAMATDMSGHVFITGNTGSTDFPIVNPYQAQNTGGEAAFVTEICPDGSSLLYSTYVGGSASSQGNAIGLDGAGDIYIGGSTYAVDFPTVNAYGATVSPNQNGQYGQYGFVSKFSADGSSLIYSTYLAGNTNLPQSCQLGTCWPSPYNSVSAIAVSGNGDAYVAGGTNTYNFPVTDGAYQATNSTSWNQDVGFICKFAPSGTNDYCTYYGALPGTYNYLYPSAIAVDSTGSLYLAGWASPWNIPITTPNICGPQNGNCDPGFITKFDSTGATVLYSTYLSSGIFSIPWSLFVDESGDAYVSSSAQTGWISLVDPIESYAGGRDLYVQEIDPTGGTVIFDTFIGGSADDYPGGITVDATGNIYLAGFTYSSDYPVTAGAFQPNLAGQANVFISKIGSATAPAVTLTAPSIQYSFVSVGSASQPSPVALRNMGNAPLIISRITTSGDFSESDNCIPGVSAAGTCTMAVTFAPTRPGQRFGSIIIEDNATGSPHTIPLVGIGYAGVAQVSTTALTFSTQPVGVSSAAQSILITNTGNDSLTFTGIQTTGDFAQRSNCATLTANGGACSVWITFTPSSSGTRSGTLVLTDSAFDSPQVVTLTGVGTDFAMPSSGGSATVQPGASAVYELSIAPVGGAFSNTIQFACANVPPSSTCGIQPGSVSLGGGGAVSIQVTIRTTGGTAQASIPAGTNRPLYATLSLAPSLGFLGLFLVKSSRRDISGKSLMTFCVIMAALLCASCGVTSALRAQNSTPAGNYTVLVTGTSGNLQHSSSLSLSVK